MYLGLLKEWRKETFTWRCVSLTPQHRSEWPGKSLPSPSETLPEKWSTGCLLRFTTIAWEQLFQSKQSFRLSTKFCQSHIKENHLTWIIFHLFLLLLREGALGAFLKGIVDESLCSAASVALRWNMTRTVGLAFLFDLAISKDGITPTAFLPSVL